MDLQVDNHFISDYKGFNHLTLVEDFAQLNDIRMDKNFLHIFASQLPLTLSLNREIFCGCWVFVLVHFIKIWPEKSGFKMLSW